MEFEYKLVAFISKISPILMLPDKTLSDTLTLTSLLSPVKAEVSRLLLPFIITPSTGIFSPFLTTKISLIFTSSTGILIVLLSSKR